MAHQNNLTNDQLFEYISNNEISLIDELMGSHKVDAENQWRYSSITGGMPSKQGKFSIDPETFMFSSFGETLAPVTSKSGVMKQKGFYALLRYQGKTHQEVIEFMTPKISSGVPMPEVKPQPSVKKNKSNTAAFPAHANQENLRSLIEKKILERMKRSNFKHELTHTYKREDGSISYVIVRFRDSKGKKIVRPLSFDVDTKLVAFGGAKPEERILYNLDKLIGNDKPVLITEGEKAADAIGPIIEEKFNVTTYSNGAGAMSKLDDEKLSPLKGKSVFLWADKDKDAVGWESFKKIAERLNGIARSVALVNINEIKQLTFEKNDVADLVESGDIKTFNDFFKFLSIKQRSMPLPPMPEEPPRSVPVDEIMSASPDFMNEASMIPEDLSSGDSRSILNLLDAERLGGSMKLKEADESHVMFILENHKKLGIKIYKDNFLQEEILEIKKKNGSIDKIPLADNRARNVIATLITRKGIKGIKKQDIASAIDAYRTDGIDEIDSLKDYIKMCVDKHPVESIPFKATDFIERYLAGEGEWSKHESGIMAMSAMSAWLDDNTTNDIDFVLENSRGIGSNSNIGKSYAAKMLAPSPEMFSDSGGIDFTKKQSIGIQLKGKAVVEFSELDKLSVKEESAYKRFLGMDVIEFDIKFSMCQGKLSKRWLPISTTNNAEYITDETERRRIPIEVGVIKKSEYQISEDREKIYAVFYHYYQEQAAKNITHNSMLEAPEYKEYYNKKVASKRGKDYWEEYVIMWLLGWNCTNHLGQTINVIGSPKQNFSINRLVEDMSALARSNSLSQKAFPDYGRMKNLIRRLGCVSDKNNNGYVIPQRLLDKTDHYLAKAEYSD